MVQAIWEKCFERTGNLNLISTFLYSSSSSCGLYWNKNCILDAFDGILRLHVNLQLSFNRMQATCSISLWKLHENIKFRIPKKIIIYQRVLLIQRPDFEAKIFVHSREIPCKRFSKRCGEPSRTIYLRLNYVLPMEKREVGPTIFLETQDIQICIKRYNSK